MTLCPNCAKREADEDTGFCGTCAAQRKTILLVLTARDFELLQALISEGSLTDREIAARLFKDLSNCRKRLRELMEYGFIALTNRRLLWERADVSVAITELGETQAQILEKLPLS